MRYKRVFNEIMREYETSRNKAAADLSLRQDEAYKKLPRLLEIDKELGVLGVGLAKLALSGNNEEMEKTRLKSKELREERKRVLALNKLADISSPKFNCEKCSDTGFVKVSPGSGSTYCTCLKQRLINEYYNLSNMKEVLADENFDTFDFRLFTTDIVESEGLSTRKNMELINRQTTNFVQNFGKNFENLLLYGETGLGKTFICHCIAKDLLDMGFTVLYLTAPRLCRFIEDYRFNRNSLDEPDEMFHAIDEVDLLIIDDLGTEISTVVTSAAIFDIINGRLLTRKPTVISSNLSPGELVNQYSERIVSRFLGNYELIKFFGNDIRVKKKYANVRM